jgi:hypothetical protein
MNKIIFPSAWILIICISFVTAFSYRYATNSISYKIVDETSIGYYFADYKQEGNSYKMPAVSVNETLKNSDLVVKVTVTNNRKYKFDSILTMAKVDQVYKGNHELINQYIYIYEWSTIRLFNNNLVYQSKDGYNIMNAGDQYYLFLKFNKMPDKYKYSDDDLRTYLLTNIYNSKYKVIVCEDMKVLPQEEIKNKKNYGDIKAWDVLPIGQEQIEQYLSNRKIVLSLLKIND